MQFALSNFEPSDYKHAGQINKTGSPLMSAISDREKAFENMFVHDQDTKFRSIARRNKLVGLWAAEILGKADAEAYAKDVVAVDFEEAGDEDVVRKIVADFEAAAIAKSADDVRDKLVELLAVAIEQIKAG
jgi:hypothetical protein